MLVVEDDPATRALIAEVLSEAGCDVLPVHDGLPGLHAALAESPDVILLDQHTPDLDGAGFLRLYRALPGPHARVVLLSGDADLPQLAAALGADGYLVKPFDLDGLIAAVSAEARATVER